MLRRTLETLIALAVIAVLFYFLMVRVILVKQPLQPAPPRDFGAVLVETRSLGGVERWPAVQLSGNFAPRARLKISAEVGGRVTAVLDGWRQGCEVSKGELLFAVDPKPSQLALATAAARLAEAEAALASATVEVRVAKEMMPFLIRANEVATRVRVRLAGLIDTGESSASMVDGAIATEVQAQLAERTGAASLARATSLILSSQARVRTAEAAVAQAQEALRHLAFKAPFAGTLTADGPELGALLTPGGSLFSGATLGELIDLGELRLLAQVHGSELARIQVGALAKISIPAMPGLQLEGEVLRIAPLADPLTRSLVVEIRTKQLASQRLPAGVFARAEIEAAQGGLPSEAIYIERGEFIWNKGEAIAFIVQSEPNRVVAMPQPLQLGAAIGEGFLVTGGLFKEAILITGPLDRLDPLAPTPVEINKP